MLAFNMQTQCLTRVLFKKQHSQTNLPENGTANFLRMSLCWSSDIQSEMNASWFIKEAILFILLGTNTLHTSNTLDGGEILFSTYTRGPKSYCVVLNYETL